MTVAWITTTPKLSQGIEYINKIDSNKFEMLLSHINNIPVERQDEPFSAEELKKLQKSLHLNNEEIEVLISVMTDIMKHSHRVLMKPATLQEDLVKMKFNPEKADVFLRFWTAQAQQDVPNLQERKRLNNLSWQMNLTISTDTVWRKPTPSATIQMELKDNQDKSDLVTFEMDEEDLFKMYNEMEQMQCCLDEMKK